MITSRLDYYIKNMQYWQAFWELRHISGQPDEPDNQTCTVVWPWQLAFQSCQGRELAVGRIVGWIRSNAASLRLWWLFQNSWERANAGSVRQAENGAWVQIPGWREVPLSSEEGAPLREADTQESKANTGLCLMLLCKFRFDGTPIPLTAAWPFRSERHEFPLLTA